MAPACAPSTVPSTGDRPTRLTASDHHTEVDAGGEQRCDLVTPQEHERVAATRRWAPGAGHEVFSLDVGISPRFRKATAPDGAKCHS